TGRVNEGLRLLLGGRNRLQFAWLRRARVRLDGMPRVQTADPRVPLGEQHILQVRPVFQAIGETTRSPKSVGCYAQPLLHRDGAHANVLVDEPRGRFALSQPRRGIEAVLGPAHLSSLDVYMIVSMIADAMAQLHDLLEPGDAGMLENTADDKKVHL